MPFAILCLVLKRWEPFATLDFFREHPFGEWLPTREQLARIIRILKERVEQEIKVCCVNAAIINIAVDGWSDQCGRRSQVVTARLVDPRTLAAWTQLLTMKEIKSTHESAGELRAFVECVQRNYAIHERTLNLCSDRASMNESAFRDRFLDPGSLFHGHLLWLPSTCHMLNHILAFFFEKIHHRLKPISHLEQRFRKCG
jgi:hypothetical protein